MSFAPHSLPDMRGIYDASQPHQYHGSRKRETQRIAGGWVEKRFTHPAQYEAAIDRQKRKPTDPVAEYELRLILPRKHPQRYADDHLHDPAE